VEKTESYNQLTNLLEIKNKLPKQSCLLRIIQQE